MARLRRETPGARARNAESQRKRRSDPAKAAIDREASRQWKLRNPERAAVHNSTPEKVVFNLKWRERNRDKVLESARRYQAKHPEVSVVSQQRRRARKLATEASLTASQWRQILMDFNHRCAYCLRGDVPLQQEHMQPLSKLGEHAVGNVIPACAPCNYKKHTKGLLQFLSAGGMA